MKLIYRGTTYDYNPANVTAVVQFNLLPPVTQLISSFIGEIPIIDYVMALCNCPKVFFN